MTISERQERILELLRQKPKISVSEMSAILYVSEPTVRRDLTELDSKGLIHKVYGGAVLPDGAETLIPFVFRENEKSAAKTAMGRQAAELVKDGMVVLLDGSTSAFHLVPFLAGKKELTVVTSGAKTALALAEAGLCNYCTGGKMLNNSYSYVGAQAERFVRDINADIVFFSCRGLSADGKVSDPSVEEVNLRRVMMEHSTKTYLLCDRSKFGKTYFYNLCRTEELDGVISDGEISGLPDASVGAECGKEGIPVVREPFVKDRVQK